MYRLRDIREDRDLNQTQVAQILHISQTTYSRYESGYLDVPSEALIALSKVYNVSKAKRLGLKAERT